MFAEFLSQKMAEKNFSTEDVSRLSGVLEKYISALVKNDFTNLPANVFVRGYLQKIAQILDTDEENLWNLYLQDYNNIMPPQIDMLPANRFDSKGKLSDQISKISKYAPVLTVIFTILGFVLFQSRILFGKPPLKITTPLFESVQTTDNPFMIEGEGQPHSYININGKDIYLSDDGKFSEPIQLKAGLNEITIEAKNRIGKTKKIIKQIYFETSSPVSSTPSVSSFPLATPSLPFSPE